MAGLPAVILVGSDLKEKVRVRFAHFRTFLFWQTSGEPGSAKIKKSGHFRAGLFLSSGWQDSNLRPSGPKPDALTGLRYTPLCPP
jgi:hypothetical protein